MRSVNNKYLIENKINREENFSDYLVLDSEKNIKYILCILKNDFTYERSREYLLSRFKTVKSLNFDYVTKIINLEIIYSINGIKLEKPQYGYLMENIESKIDTQNYFKKCTSYKKLDIFMELCAAINSLNMQGYIFNNITIKDIKLIPISKNDVKVKIKNLLQDELIKLNSLPYQSNIETREERNTNKDNIGQVIKLFNQIFTEEELKDELKELNDIKKRYNQVNTINKSFKLKYFIKDINDKMKKDYNLFISDALDKIEIDLDIVGMDEEIKIVEKNFQKILESKENYKIIAFNGEDGSGKSKLLEEIKYKIENKYFKDVIYIKNFTDKKMNKKDKYDISLKYIYTKIDKNLKDKYEIYIKEFISILFEEESVTNENEKKLQLINRMGKFVGEYTLGKPLIILIDDLDEQSEIFKLFIRYICFLGNNLENALIIFSMNENRSDKKFLEFIKDIKELQQYEEYKINYFNQYNTSKMIKRVLNTNEEINKLSLKIYSETLGNPQYITGVIRELYENKKLYFDKVAGQWETDIKAKDILIPESLQKRLEVNMASLYEEEIEILKKLSIFQTPLSETIILKYIITKLKDIEFYRGLKSKDFLGDKISDQGILVGFTNNLLRNILYLKFNEEEKVKMHRKASIFMEEVLFETDYYIEEFLIHLEKGKNYEKAYFYTLKYAKVQEVLENPSKSILYYKKALKYPNSINVSEIAINIAKLYEKSSKHERSYEYFEKANQFAIQNDELEVQIYTLLEMIIMKINDITETNSGIEYVLNCVRRLLDEEFYPKGEVYYHYALALKYRAEYNHNLTLFNAHKALSICKENKIKEDVYGWIAVLIAGVHINEGNYKEAKELCLNATKIFIDNSNINGQLYSELLHKAICKEEGYPNKVILEKYMKISRMSNKHKVYKKEILSLIYIANIYSKEKKYDYAEEYLLRALEREREEGIDIYSFKICNELCFLYIKLGKIKLSIKYYYLTKQMQSGLKLLEEEIINSNYTYALYNLLICNYDVAYDYLKIIYPLIFNSKNFNYKIIVCNYYELMIYKCKNEYDIKNVYSKLNDKIENLQDSDIELEIKINTIRRILALGYVDFARELFLNLKGYPKDYNIEGSYIYLEFNFRYKSYYNFLINKALRIAAFINNQEIKADIYTMIGQKYTELKCNSLAMNYYYESIALHIDIVNSLPNNDKLLYVNNSKFLKTRKTFIKCLNNNLNVIIDFKEIEVMKSNQEIDEALKELSLTSILGDKHIFKLMQNLYEKCYYNDLYDIYKVFERFSNDTISDIKNIMKYMARLTLAEKAMIVTENNEGENQVICTYRISDKNEIDRYLSLKVDLEEDVSVICNNDSRFQQLENEILKYGIKSCMYMKIVNREKNINSSVGVNARLILITNNAINYINIESKKTIEKFKPFLTFLLEKHNLTISSTLDKLTGVYNRKYFEEALLFLLDNSRLERSEFAVIMFDIDDFKGINDKYGHQTGDEVLVKLTKEVKKAISKGDTIGRYGGEEFIVLLPNVNKEKAMNIAEKIRDNIEKSRILGDKRTVSISVGIAMSAYELLNSEEIIERADQALYKAKHEGKNRCIIWESDCGISCNTNNDLTGVLSGNGTKDHNLALSLKEVANLAKYRGDKREKIYKFISKIMQTIECETVTAFIVKDKKIINMYSKVRANDEWDVDEKFNFKLIYQTIEEEKGMYLVDWESMDDHNNYGIPDWKSVCIAPIICNGEILAILYLSFSVNKKEFTCSDYNLLNCFAEIGVPIFY